MATIFFIDSEKGSMGKSLFCRCLLHFLEQKKTTYKLVDTDPKPDVAQIYQGTKDIQFTASDTSIQDSSNASNEAGFVSDSDGEVDPFSGQVLYIENRSPVTRTTLGTEDIKVIVQF